MPWEEDVEHLALVLGIAVSIFGLVKFAISARQHRIDMLIKQAEQTKLLLKIDKELHSDGAGGPALAELIRSTAEGLKDNSEAISELSRMLVEHIRLSTESHVEINRRLWELASSGGYTPQPRKMMDRHHMSRDI